MDSRSTHHSWTISLLTGYLNSLSLSFPICPMEIMAYLIGLLCGSCRKMEAKLLAEGLAYSKHSIVASSFQHTLLWATCCTSVLWNTHLEMFQSRSIHSSIILLVCFFNLANTYHLLSNRHSSRHRVKLKMNILKNFQVIFNSAKIWEPTMCQALCATLQILWRPRQMWSLPSQSLPSEGRTGAMSSQHLKDKYKIVWTDREWIRCILEDKVGSAHSGLHVI